VVRKPGGVNVDACEEEEEDVVDTIFVI